MVPMSELDAIFQGFLQGSFSVVVAAFLLIRMEKELRHLREAIDNLRLCQTCRFSPLNTRQSQQNKNEAIN